MIGLCTLSGPFGTLKALPVGIRALYWTIIIVISGIMALWAHSYGREAGVQSRAKMIKLSCVFGAAITILVLGVSLALLHPLQHYPGHAILIGYSFPSASLLFFISVICSPSYKTAKPASPPAKPAIFKRLSRYRHSSKILSLTAQDHYVEVTTDHGAELCVIRLRDAIAEAAPIDGFLIHRSHWIAVDAITRFDDTGSQPTVTLCNGKRFRVSKSRRVAFRGYLLSKQP